MSIISFYTDEKLCSTIISSTEYQRDCTFFQGHRNSRDLWNQDLNPYLLISGAGLIDHPVSPPYSVAFLMRVFFLRTSLFLQLTDTRTAHFFMGYLPSPMAGLSKNTSSELSETFMQEECPGSSKGSFYSNSYCSFLKSWPFYLISAYVGLFLAFLWFVRNLTD